MSDHRTTVQNLITFRNSQGLESRATLLRFSRNALVFEVYNPYSIVQLSEVLTEITIKRGERVVYQGRGVVNSLVNTGLMLIVSTTLVDPWQDLSGLLESPLSIGEETRRFVDDWSKNHRVRPGFRLAVGEIRSFLAQMHRWLEQVGEEGQGEVSTQWERDAFEEIATTALPPLYEMLLRFEEESALIETDELGAHRNFVQADLHPLIMRAPFVHRAFTKPLGYAGDYQMVRMMLTDGAEGPSLYAKLVNAFHVGTGVARAHKNRVALLERSITEVITRSPSRPIRVLNIGCGPAEELQRVFDNRSLDLSGLELQLMDFNEETLAFAREALTKKLEARGDKPSLNFVHDSVHSLLKAAAGRGDPRFGGDFDMVYCAGLFDYLSDKICKRLVRLFASWTRPGGRVLVTNVHPSNENRWSMELILEWHLIYRDEKEMEDLIPGRAPARVYRDETGVNIFLELDKALPE